MDSQEIDVRDQLETNLDLLLRLNKMKYCWDWNPPWVDVNKYVIDVIGKLFCFGEMNEREDFNERIDALKTLRVLAINILLGKSEEDTVDGGEEEETNSNGNFNELRLLIICSSFRVPCFLSIATNISVIQNTCCVRQFS